MSMLAMKTHEYIKELIDTGMPAPQAEAIARYQSKIIDENLATKHDVESVKHEIELVKYAIELARKELLLKLGAIFTAGWVATIGIILGVMSVMLE